MANTVSVKVKANFDHLARTPRHLTEVQVLLFNEFLHQVYMKSQNLVPRETGALAESAVIHEVTPLTSWLVEGEISYGNQDVDYALYVHENLEDHHEAPTQAKFLEQPFEESLSELRLAMKQAFRRVLES